MSSHTVHTMTDLQALPLRCANCGLPVDSPALYCSQLCSQEAEWVRYVRVCRRDGRISRPDVLEAIRIRFAHLLAGGYDKRGRELSAEVRERIIVRDQGRCRICGQPGDEIDHIAGGSNEEHNLQLLCDSCHNKKTQASITPITEATHPEKWAKAERLKERAYAEQPLQFCDSSEWGANWRAVLSRRKSQKRGATAV